MTAPLHRVTITFTDGVFTVDVAAEVPRALELALIDARMGHPDAVYSGALLAHRVEPVCVLRIDAHCVDDEFEADILKTYGVKITERDKAPWEWAFEGTRGNLQRMWAEHWGDAPERMPEIVEVRR